MPTAVFELTRRHLSALLCAAGAACNQAALRPHKPALRNLNVSLPPGRTEELLQQLRVFARENDFRIWMRTLTSSIGTRHTFELRRRDIWIEGLNPLKDIPNPCLLRIVNMEIDTSKFVAIFVRGDVKPSEAALDAMVSAFVESMERLDGVAVTSEPR